MWSAIALISLAAGAHQGWSANLFTTPSDMFPRSAVGSVVGIGGMAGSAGSALFALFAGHTLQAAHNYAILFGIAAGAPRRSRSICLRVSVTRCSSWVRAVAPRRS